MLQNSSVPHGPRRGPSTRWLSTAGLLLLGWQGAALAITVFTQVDLWLVNMDPAWVAALVGGVLMPPVWVMPVAVIVGLALLYAGLSGLRGRK